MKAKQLNLDQVYGAVCMAVQNYYEYESTIPAECHLSWAVKNHVEGYKVILEWVVGEKNDESVMNDEYFILKFEDNLISIEKQICPILDVVKRVNVESRYTREDYISNMGGF